MSLELSESLQVALANMKANKMRSLFSMLGIVIATTAVIVVVSIVNGSREATLEELRAGKENMLLMSVGFVESTGRFGKIELDDIEKVKRIPMVQTAFPRIIQETDAKGSFGRSKAIIFAIDYTYTGLYRVEMIMGRTFTQAETAKRPRICLISNEIAQKLFGYDYPIGQRVRFSYGSLEVVGVFKSEQRLKRMDQYGDILIPLNSAIQLLNNPPITSVQIFTLPGKSDQVFRAVQQMISEGGRLSTGVALSDMKEYVESSEKWSRSWLIQMTLIASISLLVGGVGLMNVMLTTVAERTHEIGLRKALGADSRAVLHQFLVESVVLSGLGGAAGVLLGLLISYSLTIATKGKILISVVPLSLVVSFLFSVFTGLIFGLFPASKAANLSPVEALRYE